MIEVEDLQTLLVSSENDGQRLDCFIASELGISRRQAQRVCSAGEVRVNGRRQKPGHIVKLGDIAEIASRQLTPVAARPELVNSQGGADKFVELLYEDRYLLIVNKPAKMHSVTLAYTDPVTCADCLSALCPETLNASKDLRESGLVQRLDYFSSGAMIAAKSSELWKKLHLLMTQQTLAQGALRKSYLAVVEREPKQKKFLIDLPLKTDKTGTKMICDPLGLIARSEVEMLQRLDKNQTLVCVQGSGMRRHQIRAHLSSLGHPLVGDELYGASTATIQTTLPGGEKICRAGFFLHAEQLIFTHPISGKQIDVRCRPLPS